MLNESYSLSAIWHSPGTRQDMYSYSFVEQTNAHKADEITKIDDALDGGGIIIDYAIDVHSFKSV